MYVLCFVELQRRNTVIHNIHAPVPALSVIWQTTAM